MNARTSKEALVAQLLGELDTVLNRVEALPKQVDNAELQITQSVAALIKAGEKYREAVTDFTEGAKKELTDFIERKAGNVANKAAAEQRAKLTEAARKAVATEAEKINLTCNAETKTTPASRLEVVREHAITASMASVVTAVIVYTIMKLNG